MQIDFTIPARPATHGRPATTVSATQIEDGVAIIFTQSAYDGHLSPADFEVYQEQADSCRFIVKVRRK
jgi:hypothetical protein